ncbi:MAG: hypothetical protein C6Y22_04075 [Hapalosiphonaceae cyanobacterium JJU2]|nr:MAG: hypothetical protein C6Y22_04075 [Hapalosiphonaceae cyanobacterium JJU2]
MNSATTNRLNVAGTNLTSTVNGVAYTVNLTNAVNSATTNRLQLIGTTLTSIVNGRQSNAVELRQRFWYSSTHGHVSTIVSEWRPISGLHSQTITLDILSRLLITLNCPETFSNTKGLRVHFRIAVREGREQRHFAEGSYTTPEANYRTPITVTTVVELPPGTYIVAPEWRIGREGPGIRAEVASGMVSSPAPTITVLTIQAF